MTDSRVTTRYRIPEQYADNLGRFHAAHAGWLFGRYLRAQRDRKLASARELAADLVQDTFKAAPRDWELCEASPPGQGQAS
jgi:hypothetical protein